MSRVQKAAELLSTAYRKAPVHKISAWPTEAAPRNIEEAYQVAAESAKILGLPVAGWKVLDTLKTRDQFSIKFPIYGRLFKPSVHEKPAADLNINEFNAPRVEPHYTFKMASDVTDKVEVFSVQSKIAEMRTSMEVTDSRFDYPVENTESALANYVADHCRTGQLFIGERGNWMDVDMSSVEASIYVNDNLMQQTGHTEKQNPLTTLITFLNQAVAAGIPIKKNQWVSVALNFPAPQQVKEGDEVVVYTPGMTEVTLKF